MSTPAVPTLLDRLIDSASRGEQLDLSRPASGNRQKFPADYISDLLRGVGGTTGTSSPPGGNLEQVRAIRIRGPAITGELDLSGRREGPLPPLEFEDCVFEKDICLRGAWLSWVSFRNCRIVHLDADECKIDCSLILDGIESPPEGHHLSWADREAAAANSSKELPPDGHRRGVHDSAAGLGLCWIELSNASIGGDVKVTSSRLCAPPRRPEFVSGRDLARYALDLRGSEIKGSLIAQPGVRAVGGISIASARIAGDVRGKGAELLAVEGFAFFAQNCHIAGNLILSRSEPGDLPFRAIGSVSFYGGEIDGALWMDGAFIQCSQDQPTALMAPHIEVDDTFTIAGSVSGPINMENVRIGSNCELNLYVVGNLSGVSNQRLLDCKNVGVQGSYRIWGLRFNEPEIRLFETLTARKVVKARMRTLLCYPGWHLIEIILRNKPSSPSETVKPLWNEVTVSLLWDGKEEAILLDGYSHRFHELNTRAGLLRLDNETAAEEYVRLFAAHISGPNGAFFLLADVEGAGSELRNYLGESTRPIATKRIPADGEPDTFSIEADVIYASTMFRALLYVTRSNGMVEMKEDGLATPVSVPTSTYYDAPYRIDTDESRDLPPLFPKKWKPLPAETAEKLLEAAGRSPTPVQGPRALFDLTGAAVKRLEDADGTAVGRSVRLQLEGFRYEQIEEPSQTSQVSPLLSKTALALYRITLGEPIRPVVSDIRKLIAATIRSGLAKARASILGAWMFLRNSKQVVQRQLLSLATHKFLISRNQERKSQSWQRRLSWLALQYEWLWGFYAVEASTFVPQPYDQLAAVLRAQGKFEDSRRILSRKLTLERHLKRSAWLRPLWWLYWLGFDYGLSAGRALATLLLFIALGVVAARSANSHGLLVAATSPVPGADISAYTPCGANNSPTLYAVEEFIPVASLRSAPSCRVRSNAHLWRFGEVAYRILGWIILSLSILTFTGVARRHLKK